jgi:peptide/nickel transport system substrate-binding protein
MADGAGSIWLAVPDAGNVVRIDDATRQVTDTIPVGGSPSALAVGGGSVWAAGVPGDTIDRAALVRLYGGPAGATLTCQILPPGVFGHRRYCPYTRQPGADGRWQARDLARARQLVAASGTRGDRITVYGRKDGSVTATTALRYTAQVLRELGYRVQLRIYPVDYYVKASPATWRRIQIGTISASDVTPITFFANFFGCTGPGDHGWFCDPRLDHEVQHAHDLYATDKTAARLLATKIDREIVDRALAVPLVNLHLFEFFSAHVHGYVANPIVGLIADQVSLR